MTADVGGWIKGYRLLSGACEWSSADAANLDPERLAYFREYKERYYNDRFVYGWGTEDILSMISRNARPDSAWLDVGCGTETLLWSIAVPAPRKIGCVDCVPEALAVLHEFRQSKRTPDCYKEAANIVGNPVCNYEQVRHSPWQYFLYDTFRQWPALVCSGGWDFITAVGNFGLSSSASAYFSTVRFAAAALAPGGTITGADWVRSPYFINKEGHDNSYLGPQLVASAISGAGLRMLECKRIGIVGDKLYSAVILWAAHKSDT